MNSEYLGYYFKKINEAFVSRVNKSLKKFGITSTQMDVLVYLFYNDGKINTQRDIEKYFNLSHSTVIGVIQRLTEKGYISVEQSMADKRQRNVFLTEKAFEIKEHMIERRKNDQQNFKKYMNDEEMDSLIVSLKKVYNILQKEEEE